MLKHHLEEAKEMHADGQTFYAIVYAMEQGYNQKYTEAQIKKALGVKDNPVGHQNFQKEK